MNKQIVINCFREQLHKIRIPPFPLLKPAPTDLYTEIWGGYQNTNTKDFTDFTIYRGEIWENTKESKDLQRFHRYILRYPQNMNHTCIYGYLFQNRIPNKYRPPLSSKMRKYTTCITFGSQHIYIYIYIYIYILYCKLKEQMYEYQGFNWNPWISQYHRVKSEIILKKSAKWQGFQSKYCEYCKYCKLE